jgi:hypothetical protein
MYYGISWDGLFDVLDSRSGVSYLLSRTVRVCKRVSSRPVVEMVLEEAPMAVQVVLCVVLQDAGIAARGGYHIGSDKSHFCWSRVISGLTCCTKTLYQIMKALGVKSGHAYIIIPSTRGPA